MDGLDVPTILSGWPAVISGVGITGLVMLALRIAVTSTNRTSAADRRYEDARRALRETELELDQERDRRRQIEDELTGQVRELRNEVAKLRAEIAQLRREKGTA